MKVNDPLMEEKEISIEYLVASEQFQKYCLSPDSESIKYWEQWLIDNSEHKEILIEAKKWVVSLANQASESEIKSEYHRFTAQVRKLQPGLTKSKILRPSRALIGIAATFLILFAAYLFRASPNHVSKITTDFAETQMIELPDGSELMLNANSSIQFNQDWSEGNNREVWLTGEGFFEVVHNPKRPFIVHTSQGNIEVLGTSFNAFQRAGNMQVTLIKGKVRFVAKDKEEIEMEPGEQVRIENDKIILERVDIEPITAWRYGKMIFREASIESIIDRLKSDFDWDVEVQQAAILKKKVNASIHEINPEELLDALAAIYDLHIEKIGDKAYLIK